LEANTPAEAEKHLFIVSTPPHLRADDDINSIMRTVCIALIPAFAWAFYVFGWHAIFVTAVCVASCVVTEYVCLKLRDKPITTNDFSAVITGLLLAAVIPPNVEWWVAAVGGIFAIAIAKHCFGGLGHNIWNPALLARAFLQNSVPPQINSGSWPWLSTGGGMDGIVRNFGTSLSGSFSHLDQIAKTSTDVLTGATTLATIQTPAASSANFVIKQDWALVFRSFMGEEGGCIGEVSAVALLIGGLILLGRKIISWEIPVFYLATAGILGWALPAPYLYQKVGYFTPWFSGPWALHLVGGGLFIGAFFMATDYVTSPMSRLGRIVFAIGCGTLTICIRLYAGYPEGVCYAILIMNTCVPIIDAWTKPRVFGAKKAA
jgi:electron transport complex protein RnfD